MGFLEDLVTASILLFIVLDPVGVSPYFASIVGRFEGGERARVVRVAVVSAGVMLLGFTLAGGFMLEVLSVSEYEFMIAAGLMLLVYAAADLFEVPIGYRGGASEGAAIFPLATPLLAGPGSVATILYIKDTYGVEIALLSLGLNLAVAYPILRSSVSIVGLLGRHGTLLIGKFMSLIMAGFAVSIIVEGVSAIM